MNINAIRNQKEVGYYYLCVAFSILIYIILVLSTFGIVLVFALFFLLSSWLFGQMFKAMVLGNCVKVSERQFPDIHKLVTEAASSIGMPHVPDVFIYSSGGLLNAFAVKFLGGKYIILYSGIVDNILRRKSPGELKSIISHELGHHAAGHTGLFKQILLIPALSVPILGTAYKRACEYTADRISYAVMNDANIVCQSLLTLSHGTLILANQISKNEFLGQESRIPGIMGFVFEISSGHPRLTRRIAAVEDFAAHYKA